MGIELSPDIVATIKEELENRGRRWHQSRREDVRLISEIYAEKVIVPLIGEKIKELDAKEDALSLREEKVIENERKIKKEFEDLENEKKEIEELNDFQKSFYLFARTVSNFYAIVSRLNVPEIYIDKITDVLTTYLRIQKREDL